jgi:NAD(P)H-hydrate epimerase
MIKVCNTEQIKTYEKMAENIGITPLLLMENAAIGVASVIRKFFDIKGKNVVVCCGRGNNGGDGLAVARHLKNAGAKVTVLMVEDNNKKLSKETETNFLILKGMGLNVICFEEISNFISEILKDASLIVDAIFGTGITREVTGTYSSLIEEINRKEKKVVSIDIPSGIHSDTGKIMGCAVKADITVALGFMKLGHVIFPGREYAGHIEVVDISLLEVEETGFNLLDEEDKKLLKKRKPNTHKGDYGHLVVIGGSKGKTGAIIMAGRSALKSGAGLVTVVCPESLNSIIEACSLELMTFPVFDREGFFEVKDLTTLTTFLKQKSAIVIGPGMGLNESTKRFLIEVLKNYSGKVVIDADGLNCLSTHLDIIKQNENIDVVLTPHPGEMARLTNRSIPEILENPVKTVMEVATKLNCHVILKGATTIYSDNNGKIYFSTYGNPGMATAGSGDVLSGIIGSFLAQKYDTKEAIILALLLHGKAGDYARLKKGEYGLNASDIIENIPVVLKKWEDEIC